MTNVHLPLLIQGLQDSTRYPHPVSQIEIVETHISWVLLTGSFAYKIKKPLDLGFLDFSTLDRRRFYCEEELRLNRRLAPQIYLEVVPITGSAEEPGVQGSGNPIEYAVKMMQFPQEARLDRLLLQDKLTSKHIDALARELAEFHSSAVIAPDERSFGTPERILDPVRQNFEQIESRITVQDRLQLQRLRTWSEKNFDAKRVHFARRKQAGFIRECHGDLHLANMVWLGTQVVLFDCLEFNENLRWIDTLSEVAFVTMDLDDRARPEFARRLLNDYLELTGDYDGLGVLRFYLIYRALVRAKVACLRDIQDSNSIEVHQSASDEYRGYANLAERYTHPKPPFLMITHGLSGSGKTWITQILIEQFDAIRIRSDIERKRLHGLNAQAASDSQVGSGLYTHDTDRATYTRLSELAHMILRAGFTVIVDAAFLKRWQRDQLRAVAQERRVPFLTLHIQAPETVLRDRITARQRFGQDASEADLAVLKHQLISSEPLSDDEKSNVLTINGAQSPTPTKLVRQIDAALTRI